MRIEECTTIKQFRRELKSIKVNIGHFGGRNFTLKERQYSYNQLVQKLEQLSPLPTKLSEKSVKKLRELDADANSLLKRKNFLVRLLTYLRQNVGSLFYDRSVPLTKLEVAPKPERAAYNLRKAQKQQSKEAEKAFVLSPDESPTIVSRRKISGGGNNISGVAVCRGLRRTMEDFSTLHPIEGHEAFMAAVFDGHGGVETSKFLHKNTQNILTKQLDKYGKTDEGIFTALKETFIKLDKCAPEDTGSTAILTLLIGGKIWTACVGDSRAILSTEEGTTQLSEDANLSLKRYAKKILEKGGEILNGRILGNLKVARAIGDHLFQSEKGEALVSGKPKITCVPEGGIVVLSSDGLTDVASTKQIGAAVQSLKDKSPEEIARRLVNSAIKSGSQDNVAVIVLKT